MQRVKLVSRIPLISDVQWILIKGYACARFYDDEHYRYATDIDIACSPFTPPDLVASIRSYSSSGVIVDVHEGFRRLDLISFE